MRSMHGGEGVIIKWRGKIEAEELPLAQLFVSVLQKLGVETDSFAGMTGTLDRV